MRSICFLLALIFSLPMAWGTGPACNTPTNCTPNPPCDGTASCNYWVHTPNQTTSLTISELPVDLSPLKPGGIYCDFEGESFLNANPVVKEIPFTIGPQDVRELPFNIVLKYTKQEQKTKTASGPPCCVPGPGVTCP